MLGKLVRVVVVNTGQGLHVPGGISCSYNSEITRGEGVETRFKYTWIRRESGT